MPRSQATVHFNTYRRIGASYAEGTEALVRAANGNHTEANYIAGDLLLKQPQPDRNEALRYLSKATQLGHENATLLFFREYLPLLHGREPFESPSDIDSCDPLVLLKEFQDLSLQPIVLLLLIQFFPKLLDDPRTVSTLQQHVTIDAQELSDAYSGELPDSAEFYRIEKMFSAFVDKQLQRCKSNRNVACNPWLSESHQLNIFLVALCERCQDLVKNPPQNLKNSRDSVIDKLKYLNCGHHNKVIKNSSLKVSFKKF
ncbi:hypothetical protein GEMRC1_013262 [Eukaryota sp. GEM-RC1]